MNPSVNQFVSEPLFICNTWQMIFHEYRVKPNSDKYYLKADTNYNLADAFGKTYVKEPYLDVFSKITMRYSLNDFINMMNDDKSDEPFVFSDCIKYNHLPQKIYNNIENHVEQVYEIMDLSNIDSLYSFTNAKFANIKSSRNAVMCLDNVDCIINYCRDRKNTRWMYDYKTQMCHYPADYKLIESDTKHFFINSLAWINFGIVEVMLGEHMIMKLKNDIRQL